MRSATDTSSLTFRDIDSVADLRAVEAMQGETWGMADLDIVPLTQLSAARHVGGTLIGAFDGDRLAGFAYGFYGHMKGRVVHHSHMLAVHRDYRNRDLGFRLKVEQLKKVREDRLTDRITWTFDPLRSLNAHLNFSKLGVLSDTYKINFYGEEASSFLHRTGTDRLLVTWLIESNRVKELLDRRSRDLEAPEPSFMGAAPVLRNTEAGEPAQESGGGADRILIEIPADIGALEREDLEMARRWREATRKSFSEGLADGYIVTDFARKDSRTGRYLLRRGEMGHFE